MDLREKTKEIVKHFGFRFSKSLGQNFLIDEGVLENIADAVELDKETDVIEIGPGIGTLTQELAKRARKVVAVEIDDNLIPMLAETLGNYDNIKVVHMDAMKADFRQLIEEEGLKNVRVAANLPYYVTTPIITKLFKENAGISSITVMIQKEVAERIAAKPSTKDYGAFSLLVQYYATVDVICTAAKECFMPSPKVESEVIRMNIREKPAVDVKDEELFFKIIRAAFNLRRKTLSNALKQLGFGAEKLNDAFERAGINPSRRGETLSMEEFGKLSDILSEN